MPAIRHLKNAPITEAVVDIRVPPENFKDVGKFEEIYKQISDAYPVKDEIAKQEFLFDMSKASAAPQSQQSVAGFFFKMQGNNRMAQMRIDGFTYNWLKPYEKWEPLRDEARKLWNLYRAVRQPQTISRIAIRYINRLLLPAPVLDFRQYLTAPPEVPPGLPQGISSFLLRTVVPDPKTAATAVITQAMEAVVDPQHIAVILDIDVFKATAFDPNDDKFWETFEALRDLKNRIFFESVTDKTLELFQ